jgi:3-oxoacyl-[acyl-carrier-protein] synthase-1
VAKPFSSERRGINIGEAAAFSVLQRTGSGPRLLGVGESAHAHHMSSPDPEGRGAQLAMRAALAAGGVSPDEVDYVNTHGTGTRLNDAMEALAISQVLGSGGAAIVSTKAYTGHTLGAAGAVEAVFTLEALRAGWTPASLGAEPVDPDLPVDIATERRDFAPRTALSNSFAFGGSNVSVLFGAPE